MNIREVKSSDNMTLASIIRTVFIEYNAPKKGTVYSDSTTDKLYELFDIDEAMLFVAEEKERLLGCCGIYPTKGLPEECIEIVKFYMLPNSRGKGYGKALYEACEKKAVELGYSQLYIESTPEFKEAVGLYKKLGFESLHQPLCNTGHYGCNLWLLKTL